MASTQHIGRSQEGFVQWKERVPAAEERGSVGASSSRGGGRIQNTSRSTVPAFVAAAGYSGSTVGQVTAVSTPSRGPAGVRSGHAGVTTIASPLGNVNVRRFVPPRTSGILQSTPGTSHPSQSCRRKS